MKQSNLLLSSKKQGGIQTFLLENKRKFLLNFKTKPLQRTTHHVRVEICLFKIRACAHVIQRCHDVQHCLRPGSLDLTRVTTQSIVLVMLQANWTDARIRVLSEDLFCYMIASRIFILFARTAMSTFGVQASLTRCSHSFQYVTGTGQARPVLGLIKLHAVQLRIVYLIPCSQLLFA